MSKSDQPAFDIEESEKLNAAIKIACQRNFGVLDTKFLCQSVGTLSPNEPDCVSRETRVSETLKILKSKTVGCVLVTEKDGTLCGIFTERDYVLRADEIAQQDFKMEQVMTPSPVSQRPDETLAYTLNLMSQFGFRHLPIVDEELFPIGIVSVKDIVDYIVRTFVDELLDFKVDEHPGIVG